MRSNIAYQASFFGLFPVILVPQKTDKKRVAQNLALCGEFGGRFGGPRRRFSTILAPKIEPPEDHFSMDFGKIPYRWGGRSSGEVSDGTWRSVEHEGLRRALMTPTNNNSLTLPKGLQWTGWRLTHVQNIKSLGAGQSADRS